MKLDILRIWVKYGDPLFIHTMSLAWIYSIIGEKDLEVPINKSYLLNELDMLKVCCSHYFFPLWSKQNNKQINQRLIKYSHILGGFFSYFKTYIQLFWELASSLQLWNLGNLICYPKHIFQEINSIDQNVAFCRRKDALCQEFQGHCNFFLHMEGCTTWNITFLAIVYTWKSFCWNISSMLGYHMLLWWPN